MPAAPFPAPPPVDASAAVPSLRTLGTGSTQALPGNTTVAALTGAAPADVGTTNVGVATTAARADHVHGHGNLAGGSFHAVAVAGVSAGFISAANQTKLDGIASGATAGVTTVGAVSGTATGAALDISGTTLTAHVADGSNAGLVSTSSQVLGAGTKTLAKLVVSDTSGDTVKVNTSDFVVSSTNHNAAVGTATPGDGYTVAADVSFHAKRAGASFVLISSEDATATSDVGVALSTADANDDAAIFLDKSDARKLKFATGTLDNDAQRNSSTRFFIEQGGTVNVTGALKAAGSNAMGHSNTPQYQVDLGDTLANTKIALYNNVPAAGTTVAGIGVQSGDLRIHGGDSSGKFSWRATPGGSSLMELSGVGVLNILSATGLTLNSVAVPTISSTSTFTNKTLTSPAINGASTSGTWSGTPSFSGIVTFSAGATFGATNTYKGATGITAFATGGQASATALTSEVNFVTTVASAADSVKLPVAALTSRIVVYNLGANSVNVYPQSGSAIDALGTNAAYALAAGASRVFEAQSTTQWRSR